MGLHVRRYRGNFPSRVMNHSHATPDNGGAILKTEDVALLTYEELSTEFKRLYPIISRVFQLVGLMYDRLTMKNGLSHKEALNKIYEDHKHLHGFSHRNIRRSLMTVDNPNVPHRTRRKIRTSWPNIVDSGASIDSDNRDNTELSSKSLQADKKYELEIDRTRRADCSNCSILIQQTQKLEKEKSKVIEGFEQALQIVEKQEKLISEIQGAKPHSNQPVSNNDSSKVLEQKIALLYDPLQQAMASTFKLKENKVWLTIRFSKEIGNIIGVYTERESSVGYLSQSILSSNV